MTLLMAAASGLGAVPFFFVRRLSPRLAAAVQYALALRDDVHALSGPGFESLARYVASLGRFGPTVGALLSPVYGAFIFIFIIWAISVE